MVSSWINEVSRDLQKIRGKIDRGLLNFDSAARRRKETRRSLRDAKARETRSMKARAVILDVCQSIQTEVHDQIASVTSRCLGEVFGDRYEFQIKFIQKRGKTEAELTFLRSDGLEIDPLSEGSGGVIDVASFALRISAVLLARPPIQRIVIFDEPFKNVRGEIYQRRTAEMVGMIAKELELQIIINTDLEWLRLGDDFILIGDP